MHRGLRVPRILVRPKRELLDLISGLLGRRQGEFLGRQPPQGGVRTALVVVPPPRLDLAPRVGQRQELVRVQALVMQAAVERLDQRVVGRLAGP